MGFRRILCGVDFSEPSHQALNASVRLAGPEGKVFAVHAIDVPHYVHPQTMGFLGSEGAKPLTEIAREAASQKLEEWIELLPPVQREVVEPHLMVGAPAEALIATAANRNVDLLVTGTHGHRTLKKLVLGRVANRLIRGAPCPVLTVPENGLKPLSKLLVATDFSQSSERALDLAADLAREQERVDVDLVHVGTAPTLVPSDMAVGDSAADATTWLELARQAAHVELQSLQERALARGIDVSHCHLELGNPSSKILDLSESGQYSLLLMGTHGRSGFAHLMLGSVAETVAHHSPIPVLTVRAPEP